MRSWRRTGRPCWRLSPPWTRSKPRLRRRPGTDPPRVSCCTWRRRSTTTYGEWARRSRDEDSPDLSGSDPGATGEAPLFDHANEIPLAQLLERMEQERQLTVRFIAETADSEMERAGRNTPFGGAECPPVPEVPVQARPDAPRRGAGAGVHLRGDHPGGTAAVDGGEGAGNPSCPCRRASRGARLSF